MKCRACKKTLVDAELAGVKLGLLHAYYCNNPECHFYGFIAIKVDGI